MINNDLNKRADIQYITPSDEISIVMILINVTSDELNLSHNLLFVLIYLSWCVHILQTRSCWVCLYGATTTFIHETSEQVGGKNKVLHQDALSVGVTEALRVMQSALWCKQRLGEVPSPRLRSDSPAASWGRRCDGRTSSGPSWSCRLWTSAEVSPPQSGAVRRNRRRRQRWRSSSMTHVTWLCCCLFNFMLNCVDDWLIYHMCSNSKIKYLFLLAPSLSAEQLRSVLILFINIWIFMLNNVQHLV